MFLNTVKLNSKDLFIHQDHFGLDIPQVESSSTTKSASHTAVAASLTFSGAQGGLLQLELSSTSKMLSEFELLDLQNSTAVIKGTVLAFNFL